ncbi:DUF2194 domain-containing protein [Ornithinibacillus salinisoli]|uniref:DUF2194 domain-containing protein n=1 Tax=Ornithinibacillus salinisoli TaxID=1848459 RepID=A0ABW4VYZ4_9BACI
MSYNFRISKTMVMIILFLFLLGISIQVSRSQFLLSFGITNGHATELEYTSALSDEEVQQFQHDKMLLLYDSSSIESKTLTDNFERTLDYMKKKYETIPVLQMPADLSSYQTVIILFSDLEKVEDFNKVTDYVSLGGKVFFGILPEPGTTYFNLYQKLGIYETDTTYQEAVGVEMVSDLLLKAQGLKIDKEFIVNSSLYLRLKDTATLHVQSSDGIPLLWSSSYKDGQFMVFNGTMLSSKLNRGLISGAISYLNDDYIYPILNSKVVYIDDFPAPFPEGYDEQIYANYKRDIPTFFKDIWWPDMVKTAIKNDLTYTGVLIETYNDKIKSPFNERLVKENLKIYGRELIKMGGEVGVHGYNHQSLTLDQTKVDELGYNAWKDQQDMVSSLEEVESLFNELFPDYTLRTYVPPSNVLSEEGKKAIQKAIPSVTNLASLYYYGEEQIAYIQEFESNDWYTEIPRFTSNYLYIDESKWSIANSATSIGAFSHFIHPDDLLDRERSGSKDWDTLLKEFNKMMHDVKVNYPWMKSQTASESAAVVKNFQQAEVFVSQTSNRLDVYINQFAGELDFILRSDKTFTRGDGCEVEKISDNHYLIRAHSSKFSIELGGES